MLRIQLSFKDNEKKIYDYIKSKFNYSAYLKELVLKDMEKENNVISRNEMNNSSGGFDF